MSQTLFEKNIFLTPIDQNYISKFDRLEFFILNDSPFKKEYSYITKLYEDDQLIDYSNGNLIKPLKISNFINREKLDSLKESIDKDFSMLFNSISISDNIDLKEQ